jgi:hypothetical protein
MTKTTSLYDPRLDILAHRWTAMDRLRIVSLRQKSRAEHRASLWQRIQTAVRNSQVETRSPLFST